MIDLNMCTICNSATKVEEHTEKKTYTYNCPTCGDYDITDEALTIYLRSDLKDKYLPVSFWIRHNQSEKRPPFIDTKMMRLLLKPFKFLTPKEQANELLLWMGDYYIQPGMRINKKMEELWSVTGSPNMNNLRYIINYLVSDGIFSSFDNRLLETENTLFGILSFKGWDRYYELKRSNKDSRLAFMAMKYGEEPLNTIHEEVIKAAVSQTGYDIRKLDEDKRAGLIDDKLRVEIRRSRFLIADLTHDNNGAYWEAGYAEGLGIPVIYICEEEKFKSSKSHFDTNHHLTVTWKNDVEGRKKFAEDLKATIRATLPAEAIMGD